MTHTVTPIVTPTPFALFGNAVQEQLRIKRHGGSMISNFHPIKRREVLLKLNHSGFRHAFKVLAILPRDNQRENPASIRMRMPLVA
jgi:hypothetical protein